MMNEAEVVEELEAMLLESDDSFLPNLSTCHTFEHVGLMTSDNGLVLRMADGSEFQVTVVQSRGATAVAAAIDPFDCPSCGTNNSCGWCSTNG